MIISMKNLSRKNEDQFCFKVALSGFACLFGLSAFRQCEVCEIETMKNSFQMQKKERGETKHPFSFGYNQTASPIITHTAICEGESGLGSLGTLCRVICVAKQPWMEENEGKREHVFNFMQIYISFCKTIQNIEYFLFLSWLTSVLMIVSREKIDG